MAGVILNDSAALHEEGQQEDFHPQPASPQEPIIACEPARLSGNVLNLVLPPGSSTMEDEDNVNQANENASGSPPQV